MGWVNVSEQLPCVRVISQSNDPAGKPVRSTDALSPVTTPITPFNIMDDTSLPVPTRKSIVAKLSDIQCVPTLATGSVG